MNQPALRAHVLLMAAVIAGIAGMGMVFNAAMTGSIRELTFGMPVLMIGLWWAGHELGRSTFASRVRKLRQAGRQVDGRPE